MASYVKLWFVPDVRDGKQAAGRWRELFQRAEQLQVSATAGEKRRRGRDFERVIYGMLAEAELAPRTSFRPIGEEIDGSFFHRSRVMLLEAKWVQDPLPASSIYQFRGKVEGKLVGTIGVFISMSGFSADAVDALVAGKTINTVLFDGDDVRAVAAGQIGISAALDQKLRAAAESGTPFLPLRDPISGRLVQVAGSEVGVRPTRMVIVEGHFDALLVHALADELGPSTYQLEVLPAGGASNLAALANAANAAGDSGSVIIVADGDGNPEAVRRRIEWSLDSLSSGTVSQGSIFVLDSTLEESLGILKGLVEERRRGLELDRGLLRSKIRKADVPHVAGNSREVQRLLAALGLDR